MSKVRIIPRLDIKGSNLIKGVQLEGLRVIGNPNEYALKYYHQGADELILMDCVASLYGRNNLSHILESAVENVFIPITVGGGIRSVDDAVRIFRSGADKIAVNTAAVQRPKLISELSTQFGSQAVVLSVEAKWQSGLSWEVYTNNGRDRTGLDVIEWIIKGVSLGAGEILLTSVDREGTRQGFDLSLVKSVSEVCAIPLIVSGGMGGVQDAVTVVESTGVSALAMADILHYNRATILDIKESLSNAGIHVRGVCARSNSY